MAFRWWADDGSLLVVFGPLISLSKKTPKNVGVGPSLAKLSGSVHGTYRVCLMPLIKANADVSAKLEV